MLGAHLSAVDRLTEPYKKATMPTSFLSTARSSSRTFPTRKKLSSLQVPHSTPSEFVLCNPTATCCSDQPPAVRPLDGTSQQYMACKPAPLPQLWHEVQPQSSRLGLRTSTSTVVACRSPSPRSSLHVSYFSQLWIFFSSNTPHAFPPHPPHVSVGDGAQGRTWYPPGVSPPAPCNS